MNYVFLLLKNIVFIVRFDMYDCHPKAKGSVSDGIIRDYVILSCKVLDELVTQKRSCT